MLKTQLRITYESIKAISGNIWLLSAQWVLIFTKHCEVQFEVPDATTQSNGIAGKRATH